jgi:hypothetical protein
MMPIFSLKFIDTLFYSKPYHNPIQKTTYLINLNETFIILLWLRLPLPSPFSLRVTHAGLEMIGTPASGESLTISILNVILCMTFGGKNCEFRILNGTKEIRYI